MIKLLYIFIFLFVNTLLISANFNDSKNATFSGVNNDNSSIISESEAINSSNEILATSQNTSNNNKLISYKKTFTNKNKDDLKNELKLVVTKICDEEGIFFAGDPGYSIPYIPIAIGHNGHLTPEEFKTKAEELSFKIYNELQNYKYERLDDIISLEYYYNDYSINSQIRTGFIQFSLDKINTCSYEECHSGGISLYGKKAFTKEELQ